MLRTKISHLGPSIVVLAAAGATLFAGPAAFRMALAASTRADVENATARLASKNILAEFSAATSDVATIVEPSVVHVSTEGSVASSRGVRHFASSGSGWIWDDAGHIVTNAHVVDGADRIDIQLHTGELRAASIVGMDLRSDIAILSIEPGDLFPATRASSDDLHQGDLVFAFGSPFDFRFSMSSGIVSGIGRAAGLEDIDYENFIQVDAAINPGNSGGPLTDAYGRVVGMNTAIATGRGQTIGQGQFAGVGLAIPMSMIENVVDQVIETGVVRKGFMGVSLVELGEPSLLSAARSLPGFAAHAERIIDEHFGEGVAVSRVVDESPADRAGMQIGDVIEHVAKRRARGLEQLKSMVSSYRPGSEVVFGIWRWDDAANHGAHHDLVLILGELSARDVSPWAVNVLSSLGVDELTRSTPEEARAVGVAYTPGVLVTLINDARPLGSALPVGTTIVAVDGKAISTVDELHARIERGISSSGRFRGFSRPFPLAAILPDGKELVIDLARMTNGRRR